MIDVIIAASGGGSRMGGIYKQFSDLEGKPVVYYSIKQFSKYGVEKIVVVVPKEKVEYSKEMLCGLNNNILIVPGGKRRQDSVSNGLKECSGDIILVHDGVRPFIKKDLIDAVVKGVLKCGTCAPGIPINDTIKLYSGDKILWTKGRSNLLQIQTPQGFKYNILKDIVMLLKQKEVSDELSIIESLNGEICWVLGDLMNIKITYPGDMELALLIAKTWSVE